jgi:hypothetical protein
MHRVWRSAAQALVEAALVLPLAITLSLGIVQVVLYAHAHDVLLSAVQEGARLASEDGRGLDEGLVRARQLVTAGLGSSAEPVLVDGSRDDELVTVRADASLRPILPVPLPGGLPIRAVGRVVRERFRPGGARP